MVKFFRIAKIIKWYLVARQVTKHGGAIYRQAEQEVVKINGSEVFYSIADLHINLIGIVMSLFLVFRRVERRT